LASGRNYEKTRGFQHKNQCILPENNAFHNIFCGENMLQNQGFGKMGKTPVQRDFGVQNQGMPSKDASRAKPAKKVTEHVDGLMLMRLQYAAPYAYYPTRLSLSSPQ
jgi:hypothetical protein